jgi:hypothetical protein
MTEQAYYQNDANWGSYQYVSINDIVNNYMLMRAGNDQLVNNVERYKVLFYAKEAVKELTYDAFKEVKALEYIVQDDLKMVLPHDYVNYVRISLEIDGVLFPMSENTTEISALRYIQDGNGDLTFDINGDVVTGQSELDIRRLDQSLYTGPGLYSGCYGWCVDGDWYFGYAIGSRFGLDTTTANINGTYKINKRAGVINFASNISGQRVVLEYISDGLYDGTAQVHKMAEKFVYAYITWCILDSKIGIQEYVVRRAKNEKSALLRNLKIRLSSQHAGELLMVMRGKDKRLK